MKYVDFFPRISYCAFDDPKEIRSYRSYIKNSEKLTPDEKGRQVTIRNARAGGLLKNTEYHESYPDDDHKIIEVSSKIYFGYDSVMRVNHIKQTRGSSTDEFNISYKDNVILVSRLDFFNPIGYTFDFETHEYTKHAGDFNEKRKFVPVGEQSVDSGIEKLPDSVFDFEEHVYKYDKSNRLTFYLLVHHNGKSDSLYRDEWGGIYEIKY
jgi:hypothetical protein